ncbi:MAG: ATP-binding protein, partial [Desulfobulbaceae bacterium]|nr:ATP-binding protein [Desulfobulbaceae bacterium]
KDELLDKIFDGFAIEDIAHHHSGLGISLAIARQIFDQHGGHIHAENSAGAGAVFTVILPLATTLDPGEADTPAEPEQSGQSPVC